MRAGVPERCEARTALDAAEGPGRHIRWPGPSVSGAPLGRAGIMRGGRPESLPDSSGLGQGGDFFCVAAPAANGIINGC